MAGRAPERSSNLKITDVTVKRYSASRQPRTDPGGIQIVEVHTDAGVVAAASLVPEP